MGMDLRHRVLADRPDALADLWPQLHGFWPRVHDPGPHRRLLLRLRGHRVPRVLPCSPSTRETGQPVAKALSVPLSYDGAIADGLPEGGWDWAIRQSAHDRLRGRTPAIVSALEILIRPDLRGGGLSGAMLGAMRDNVAKLGFTDLVAPVRPTGKTQINTPIDEYALRTRAGRPAGRPVATRARPGRRPIVNVAHPSMVIPGTLDEWRGWTGLPFDTHRPGRGAAGAGAGALRRRPEPGRLRRAQRLGPPPDLNRLPGGHPHQVAGPDRQHHDRAAVVDRDRRPGRPSPRRPAARPRGRRRTSSRAARGRCRSTVSSGPSPASIAAAARRAARCRSGPRSAPRPRSSRRRPSPPGRAGVPGCPRPPPARPRPAAAPAAIRAAAGAKTSRPWKVRETSPRNQSLLASSTTDVDAAQRLRRPDQQAVVRADQDAVAVCRSRCRGGRCPRPGRRPRSAPTPAGTARSARARRRRAPRRPVARGGSRR